MPSFPRIAAYFLGIPLLIGCLDSSTGFPEQSSTKEKVLQRIKFSRDSLCLVLPVRIKGREYPFILDTGSSGTVFDTSLRSFLGEPVKVAIVNTVDAQIQATCYSSPPAQLGHFNLPAKSQVLCMDLERFRECFRVNIRGVLGMDFLGHHVFRIDFDRGEVAFLQSADTYSGVRIPITSLDGMPQVQVTIPGLPTPESFLIDTGATGIKEGNLRAEVFDILSKQGILKLTGQRLSVTASSSGFVRQGRLEEIALGIFRHKQLLFSRSSKLSCLGSQYCSRYVITFDCPRGAIYLKEGRRFNCTD